MKGNKSFTKRLKITRTGKILARKPGQNHFNAKERHATQGAKGRAVTLSLTNKAKRRFLPNAKQTISK